jgi:hypothetical protein
LPNLYVSGVEGPESTWQKHRITAVAAIAPVQWPKALRPKLPRSRRRDPPGARASPRLLREYV